MQRWQEEEVFSDDVRLFLTSPPVTVIGETPDFPNLEPDVEEEEDTVLLSWKQILLLLTRWDLLIRYSTWLHHIHLAMDHSPTTHILLAMCEPERKILNDQREISLAADIDIPRSHIDRSNNASLRYVIQYKLFL